MPGSGFGIDSSWRAGKCSVRGPSKSSPVRIALDLSPLCRPFPVSVVRTVRPIVRELERRDDVEVVGIRSPDAGKLAFWRQRGLPLDAACAQAEVLHSFTSAFSITRRLPVVQTVHELPWRHDVRGENAGIVHRAWVRTGRRFAAATSVPSPSVARDLAPHPRAHVIPWGVDLDFASNASEHDAALDLMLGEVRGAFVLAPGATRPKKRLDLIARGAHENNASVVVTGTVTPYVSRIVHENPHVVSIGLIPDELLPALYRRATCTALLAESEGFALPVLESLITGTPVIVRRDSVQSETSGGCGIEVDAENPSDVARGIEAAGRVTLAQRAAAESYAASMSWPTTADKLIALWRTLR